MNEEREACRDAFSRIHKDMMLIAKLGPGLDSSSTNVTRFLKRAALDLEMAADYCECEFASEEIVEAAKGWES